jgi:hypothetical protein
MHARSISECLSFPKCSCEIDICYQGVYSQFLSKFISSKVRFYQSQAHSKMKFSQIPFYQSPVLPMFYQSPACCKIGLYQIPFYQSQVLPKSGLFQNGFLPNSVLPKSVPPNLIPILFTLASAGHNLVIWSHFGGLGQTQYQICPP